MIHRTLGKYVLRERLGRGGMAEVYQAYQPGLERFVAVKLLHPHLADAPDFLARFQREAQAVARLRHPHIVQVFDFDLADGQPYMVMEYVEGRSLKTDLDDRFTRGEKLPPDQVVRWFDALLDAVEYAHRQGMVHRDLKPANVLIEAASGRVVLTDFGIARLVDAEKLTQTGITLGSPAYMSPEQGQGEAADSRSDIYALGIMLFECLAGQVPFEGDTSVSILLKHATAPIPSIRALRPDVPPALEAVIRRALAKKPADRFQTAADMRAALLATVDTRPHPAAPAPSRPPAPRPFALARPPWLLPAALGLVALVAALALLGPRWLAQAQSSQAIRSAQAHLVAGEAQLAADAFTAALDLDPQAVDALAGRARAYEALGDIDAALADVEQIIALQPDDGLAYAERARLTATYLALDDPAVVLADLDRAVQLAPDSARTHFTRGWALLNFPLVGGAPDPAAALPDLEQAVALDPKGAEAQFTLARARLKTGEARAALEPANRAVELAPGNAVYWTLRAHIQATLSDFNAAVDDLSGALKVEPVPTAQATLLAERAYLRLRLDARPEAEADVQQALRLDPGNALARLVQHLLAPARPPLSAPDLARARRLAPADDPIWQAVLDEITH